MFDVFLLRNVVGHCDFTEQHKHENKLYHDFQNVHRITKNASCLLVNIHFNYLGKRPSINYVFGPGGGRGLTEEEGVIVDAKGVPKQ